MTPREADALREALEALSRVETFLADITIREGLVDDLRALRRALGWSSSGLGTEPCRSCAGRGIIWSAPPGSLAQTKRVSSAGLPLELVRKNIALYKKLVEGGATADPRVVVRLFEEIEAVLSPPQQQDEYCARCGYQRAAHPVDDFPETTCAAFQPKAQ